MSNQYFPKVSEEDLYKLAQETTRLLNDRQGDFKNVKWTDNEANLETGYSQLACDCCEQAWKKIKSRKLEYNSVNIKCKSPDISIAFTYPNNMHSKHKIELKSCKNTLKLGSTIRTLDLNQPLILCRRKSDKSEFVFTCCQYHHALEFNGKYDLFQDRTPRPFNSNLIDHNNEYPFEHKEMLDWINYYAQCAVNRTKRTGFRRSWQDDLIVQVLKISDREKKENNTTVRTTSIQQLYQIPGVSVEVAEKIVNLYGSLVGLITVYNVKKTETERENLLRCTFGQCVSSLVYKSLFQTATA